MQVVTNENVQQLIDTRRVDEFKAPEAKTEVKTEVKADEAKTEVKADEKPRGADGKFLKDDSSVTPDKADKSAEDGIDPEDADLPERVRRQMGKKHRLMREAEEFGKESYLARLAAEKRAEAAETRLKQLESGKSKDDGEPDPKDFKTNAEYIDAMVEHRFEKKERAEAQKRYEQGQAKLQAEFVDRLNIARKELPDFDEVVGDADIDVVPHIASYIAESELGPKLGYHFAKNPDDLERIQKLSPIRAIAELGKLETKLETKADVKTEAKVEKVEPKISKAPSPIATVDTASKTVVQKDPAKMSFPELREYERAKERERAKR